MRYKEYSRNAILEKSIDLFWKGGFEGCSIQQLVEETGVNRFSLYQEFENKEGILYASLALYRERYSPNHLELLQAEGDPKQILKDFYLSFLGPERKHPGCYFIHIGTEMADFDPRVKNEMNEYLDQIKDLFSQLLDRHNEREEHISSSSDHLLALFCTAMSFCLIHDKKEQEAYLGNSIDIILQRHAQRTH